MKFKVGDKVRRITEADKPYKWGIKGNVYTVKSIDGDFSMSLVELSSGASPIAFELVKCDPLPEELFVL